MSKKETARHVVTTLQGLYSYLSAPNTWSLGEESGPINEEARESIHLGYKALERARNAHTTFEMVDNIRTALGEIATVISIQYESVEQEVGSYTRDQMCSCARLLLGGARMGKEPRATDAIALARMVLNIPGAIPAEDAPPVAEPVRRTLQDLAKEALMVQDACNLSGVVHGFSRAMTALRECLPNAGTDEINHHPISILWSDKIAHLTGTQLINVASVVTNAYVKVRALADKA